MSDRASRLVFWWGLLAIACLGTAARLWQINESLWLDELHTSWVVTDSIDEIAPRARLGNQNPFYFYLLWLSTLVFGDQELALRLPSLVAGVGLIVSAGFVTWRWCGVAVAGWLAAALVAVDHNMIFFSQEARPYALVQLVALWQLVAFWRLQTAHHWGSRLAHACGWILLFHLHYTAILLMAGELLWWALMQFWQRGKGTYRPAQVLCDVAVTVVVCGTTWPHLAEIASRRSMWAIFIPQRPPWDALVWFHWDVYVLNVIFLSIGLTVLAYPWLRRRRERPVEIQPPVWLAALPLLLLWWATPVLIAWSLTASDVARLFLPRYLMGVAVAPMICAGLVLAFCRGQAKRLVVAMVVVVIAIHGNGLFAQFQRDGRLIGDRQQDWRGAVAWLNANRQDASPVLVRSGLIEADQLRDDSNHRLRAYCVFPLTCLYPIERPGVIHPLSTSNSGKLSAAVVDLLDEHRGGWLVINARRSDHPALQRDLRQSFRNDELVFLQQATFGNVAVWQVALRDDEPDIGIKPWKTPNTSA